MKKNITIIDTKTYKTVSEKTVKQMIKDLPNQYALTSYQLQLIGDVYIKDLNKRRLCAIYNKIAIAINNRNKHIF